MIGDMSVKSILIFIVSLISLLKKSTNYLKSIIFLYNLGPFAKGDRPILVGEFLFIVGP